MYICIYSNRDGEVILFHHEGGIDIGDVDSKALQYSILIDDSFNITNMENSLLKNVSNDRRLYVKKFEFILKFASFFLLDNYQNL
jgi:ATP citrate (pro-S)-lyase